MSETLVQSPIPSYRTVLEQRDAGTRKFTGEDSTYLRYGTSIHSEVEERIAELAGSQAEEMLIFNSGMSAVISAIGTGLDGSRKDRPRIAYAQELYTGTTRWFQRNVDRFGAETTKFEAGDLDSIEEALDKFKPDIIFAETVGNFVGAPVLDYRGLLNIVRSQDNNPLVILDNTLPLSTECDVYDATTKEDRVVIVESGTKAYTFNAETLGIAYSKNPDVIQALRSERNEGSLPGTGSVRFIADLLPSKEEFNMRNRQVFENTGLLALALYSASQNSNTPFLVDHPSLPTHENFNQLHVPSNGNITPVIFVSPLELGSTLNFAQRIGDNREVKEHIRISDSFAFDDTAFYSADAGPYIRIAGGAKTDTKVLGTALYNALIN